MVEARKKKNLEAATAKGKAAAASLTCGSRRGGHWRGDDDKESERQNVNVILGLIMKPKARCFFVSAGGWSSFVLTDGPTRRGLNFQPRVVCVVAPAVLWAQVGGILGLVGSWLVFFAESQFFFFLLLFL
jgi:hypothetical protein